MNVLNPLLIQKVKRTLKRKADAALGRLYQIGPTLEAMAARPYELHLELTNLCNADCVFCPYQYQERKTETMREDIFRKAVADYVATGGGSVGLTPIVGDALIDPQFVQRVKYLRQFPSIDRIWVTTNAILLDRFGVDEFLSCGLTAVNISTAGFQEEMYRRVYRNQSYKRMFRNVRELVERNARRSEPLPITLCLRPDRPLDDVLKDEDFQPILKYQPELDFTWAYTNANGRIQRENLPPLMKIRTVGGTKSETCVQMYNGPVVLSNGTVLACSCVASMDAGKDLGIGNILEKSLSEIWTGHQTHKLRQSFANHSLNPTCNTCDMYRDLELYRTSEGRERARINRARQKGERISRAGKGLGPFSGG
jgi:radical SAM protein with 4Fe4S-binding SPASM domain